MCLVPAGTGAATRNPGMALALGWVGDVRVNHGRSRDWYSSIQGEGAEFLRAATDVKNIWTLYGE